MIVKLMTVVCLLSVCLATRLQYPAQNPCILIDVTANNSLSWEEGPGEEHFIPNWNFTDSEVVDGNCNGSSPFLEVLWKVDNGTMRFDFMNASSMVNVQMTLAFDPEIVFKGFNNTDNSTATIPTILKTTAHTDRAFKCDSPEELKGSSTSGNNTYKMTLRLSDVKIQGFEVENGTYSEFEECGQDTTTHMTTHSTEEPTTGTVPPTAKPTTPTTVTLNATDNGTTCAVLRGELTLQISYELDKGGNKETSVFVPSDVKSEGVCLKSNETLTATFGVGWMLNFVFSGDKDNFWWEELSVTVHYDNMTFPGINQTFINQTITYKKSFSKAFEASRDGSYMCEADLTTDLGNGLKLKTHKFQYMAFTNFTGNSTKFPDKNTSQCSADKKTNAIVPIAVGAALAGLVVIVLIAYLIGRRRNRKGYESV